jgi:hypothetical protein
MRSSSPVADGRSIRVSAFPAAAVAEVLPLRSPRLRMLPSVIRHVSTAAATLPAARHLPPAATTLGDGLAVPQDPLNDPAVLRSREVEVSWAGPNGGARKLLPRGRIAYLG